MDYSQVVRRHFSEPANLGPLEPRPGECLCRGAAGSVAAGAQVTIEAAVRESQVLRLAFRAFGCPHLIAACSRATELLAPGPVAGLAAFAPEALMAEFGVPAEKLGSLLILQDALRNCFRDWDTTQPAEAR